MPLKDHDNYYDGLNSAPTPTAIQVSNTVSRNLKLGDRSFAQIVVESGKPVLDSDANAYQEVQAKIRQAINRWQFPSGFLKGQARIRPEADFTTETVTPGFDDGGTGVITGGGYLLNSFVLPKLEAVVAGHPITLEYTHTTEDGYNLVILEDPTIYDGTNNTVKRTDFVFLEVWKSLVAPSPSAYGSLLIDTDTLVDGDTIVIDGVTLTARAAAPGVDEFLIGATDSDSALAIETAINDAGNSFDTIVTAVAIGDTVYLTAVDPGTAGNAITLTTTSAGVTVSGATLTGGEDRPNKPDQSHLYRHGNVDSPSGTWLDDDILDPAVNGEASQRVQIQYRVRVTGADEAVNHKTHPDGFSNSDIYARGGREQPVYAGNPAGDTMTFPFVRADGVSVQNDSSAVAYGIRDPGLWIAGDGTEVSAQTLGALDGFVYAIPICFVFRHNDCSDVTAAVQGFDPLNNANGAPAFDHAGYVGVIGTILPGLSDRPDGHYADVVTSNQILDMRKHITPSGLDLNAELQYQYQLLLDNSLSTWAIDMASKEMLGGGSGDVATYPLVCNEVGRSTAAGGTNPTSGTTDRGEFIRNFDHIARRFASQPVIERVVVAFYPGDRPTAIAQGGPVAPGLENAGKYVVKSETLGVPNDTDTWYEDDVLHLDLDALDVTTLGGVFQGLDGGGTSGAGLASTVFSTFAPPGTVVTDILSMYHDDGHYTTAVDQSVEAKFVRGLGTRHIEIVLDANDSTVNGGDSGNPDTRMVGSDVGGVVTPDGSARRIFVEFEITYPIGVGTTNTVFEVPLQDATTYDGTFAGPGPQIETDVTQRPVDMETPLSPRFRTGYREVQLEYVANDTVAHGGPVGSNDPIGSNNVEQIVSRNRTTIYFPRRVYDPGSGALSGRTAVTDGVTLAVMTVDDTLTEYGSSSRKVAVTANLSGTGQTRCRVEYFAQDPVPNYGAAGGGYQTATYFRTKAPQTAGTMEGLIDSGGAGTLPRELVVEPLAVGQATWTGQVGQGSNDRGFPYTTPLEQIPINDGTAIDGGGLGGTTEEWFFAANANVVLDAFDASTGLLALHTYMPPDMGGTLTLGGNGVTEKPRRDADFRAFYPTTDTDAYMPMALAQPLYGATRHKVMVPMLCRVSTDVEGASGGLLFRESELVLVVLTRFAELDNDNTITFLASNNRSSAAVYKTQGLLTVVNGED